VRSKFLRKWLWNLTPCFRRPSLWCRVTRQDIPLKLWYFRQTTWRYDVDVPYTAILKLAVYIAVSVPQFIVYFSFPRRKKYLFFFKSNCCWNILFAVRLVFRLSQFSKFPQLNLILVLYWIQLRKFCLTFFYYTKATVRVCAG